MDERELIARVRAGDAVAERRLYDAHVDRVYRLAYRLAGGDDLAQDFTQETFIRAFQQIEGFRGEAAFGTWLYAIATTVVLNGLRKVKRFRQREADLDDAAAIGASSGDADPDLKQKLANAVDDQAEILRRFIDRPGVSDELKATAIFWLGQKQSSETLKYLQDLYPRLQSEELKEKAIFSISQMRGADSQRWLLDVALSAGEPMEMRKKALFWAGLNRNVPIVDLARLYDTMSDREMKEQLIFAYSQRRESEAVDKLMAIAENDPDRELRSKAIFWLGQSKDPRAAEFLLRLINK